MCISSFYNTSFPNISHMKMKAMLSPSRPITKHKQVTLPNVDWGVLVLESTASFFLWRELSSNEVWSGVHTANHHSASIHWNSQRLIQALIQVFTTWSCEYDERGVPSVVLFFIITMPGLKRSIDLSSGRIYVWATPRSARVQDVLCLQHQTE